MSYTKRLQVVYIASEGEGGIWLICTSVSEQFQFQHGRTDETTTTKKSVQEEMAETSSCVHGRWEVDNQWDTDWGSRAGIWAPTVETEFEFMDRIVLCDYLFTAGTAEALLVGLKRMKIIQK